MSHFSSIHSPLVMTSLIILCSAVSEYVCSEWKPGAVNLSVWTCCDGALSLQQGFAQQQHLRPFPALCASFEHPSVHWACRAEPSWLVGEALNSRLDIYSPAINLAVLILNWVPVFLLMIFLKPFLNDFKKIMVFVVRVPSLQKCVKDIRCSQFEVTKAFATLLHVLDKRICSVKGFSARGASWFPSAMTRDVFDSAGLFAF